MLIGINCFRDTEICSMVESQKRIGICDITKEKNIAVYDTESDEYLQDDFTDILDVYTPLSELPGDFPKEHLKPLAEILKEDWSGSRFRYIYATGWDKQNMRFIIFKKTMLNERVYMGTI